MNVTIASGKGGTGKTTVAVNLAYYLSGIGKTVRLLDGDVEEPNDHLFVPAGEMEEEIVTVLKPELEADLCVACGKCVEACRYNALAMVKKKLLFFSDMCHVCGVCSHVCPNGALTEKPAGIGKIRYAEAEAARPFYFAYGILDIGQSLAPAVVRQLKRHMVDAAGEASVYNILDASPGTACPVVEALSGNQNIAVLVTEPTPFGLNDLKLAAELALSMKNPTGIIINRSDGRDDIIAEFAAEAKIPILGRISFARKYAETYSRGEILLDRHPELSDVFAEIVGNIESLASSPPVGTIPSFSEPQLGQATDFHKSDAGNSKEIVVISGKGGTGKTTITASLAQLCGDNVVFDADVDAADLHLLLHPTLVEVEKFSGGDEFVIDSKKCWGCGQCAANCHFDAIDLSGPGNDLIEMTYEIDAARCEGCGFCQIVCSAEAVSSHPDHSGDTFLSVMDDGKAMSHAKLGVGGENSGKLVAHVRSKAAKLADELKQPFIIGDGPPGTGCPVIASVSGADLVLMVTEPTLSGLHDLERVMELIEHFRIPFLVIINKADLNSEISRKIHEKTAECGSKVLAEIPFDRNIHEALMAGKTILEHGKGEAFMIIKNLWTQIKMELKR